MGVENEYRLARLRAAHGLNDPQPPATPVRIKSYIEEQKGIRDRITKLSESTGLRPAVLRRVVLVDGQVSEPKAARLCATLGEFTERYGREIAGILDERYFKKDGKIFKNRARKLINSQGA